MKEWLMIGLYYLLTFFIGGLLYQYFANQNRSAIGVFVVLILIFIPPLLIKEK